MRISDWSSDVCSSDLRVLLQLITVQRNIARLATRTSQLSQFLLCGAADQGMILKDLHSLGDETHRFQRRGCFCLHETISASAEIGERRSEARRSREEGVCTCSPRWSPEH